MLEVKDNIILVLPNSIKVDTIKDIRSKGLYNIKFMTFEELTHKFYFDYNRETIYYLMTKYNYKYDVALVYLNNLYYLSDNDHNVSKLIKLRNIKEELDNNNLLIYDNLFKDSLKNKEIVIYGYNYLTKYQKKVIEELKSITKVTINKLLDIKHKHNNIYSFNTIEEEVAFVAESICKDIKNNIDINNIAICFNNKEYNNYIKRIFKLYNIPIELDNSNLYSTSMARYLLDNINKDINITLKDIETNFNLKNPNSNKIYNMIIDVLSNYTFCDNYLLVKDMLIYDFKNTSLPKNHLSNKITITNNLDSIKDNYNVYLMDFNQKDIPNTYKDEEYLSDSIKTILDLDTSNDLNKYSIDNYLYNINRIKNLTITYKLTSNEGPCYLSSLNDYLNLDVVEGNIYYKYSNTYNKLILGSKIDTYLKYNEKDTELDKLYSTYPSLNYNTYDNTFTGIDKDKLRKHLNNKLSLSYSTINDYYHCNFRYYISNVLKLNIYNETFMTILGNTFHYILSICFNKNINISLEYDNYLNKVEYIFSPKEKYFLESLKKELIFIIDTIKKQYEYNSLNNVYYEEKITIDKSTKDMEIIFKGFIDKLMLDDNNSIGTIIDYKTGNPNLDLNNSIYGIDLQLPVYIYLAKNRFPNIRIVGFYLQKILNSKIKRDSKKSYEEQKEDSLKLQGYTNSDENIIKLFDSNYTSSKVIKGMKTTSTGLGTKKILDDIKIDKLSNIVDNKVDEAIEGIVNGNFTINPKRIGKDNIGCNYCPYKDICYMTESDIVNLKTYKNLEFLEEN